MRTYKPSIRRREAQKKTLIRGQERSDESHLVEAGVVDLVAGVPELVLGPVARLQPRAAGGELLDPVVDALPLGPPAVPRVVAAAAAAQRFGRRGC